MQPKPSDNDEDLARTIESIDWAAMTARLLAFTAYRLARYGAFRARLGKTPADYVQEAVKLLLTGQRHFPRDANLSVFSFLCGIISSLASHDAERASRLSLTGLNFAGDEDLLGEEEPLDDIDIEREVVARDESEHFILSLDADLQAYVRLRLSGDYRTAHEYARALNISVAELRNLDRRLRRRRAKH